MKKSLIPICILLSLLVGSCAVTGPGIPKTGYNFFFTPGKHVEELVNKGKFDAAEQVYMREIDYFRKHPHKYQRALVNLAKHLNQNLEPQFKTIISNVDAINWPEPYADWSHIYDVLKEGKKAFRDYDARPLFKNTGQRLLLVDLLKSKVDTLKKRIKNNAVNIFSHYSLSSSPDFFLNYPVSLNANTFITSNIDIFKHKIMSVSPDKIKLIFDKYKTYLSTNFCDELGTMYYKKTLNDVTVNSRPDFSDIICATTKTSKSGIPIVAIPDVSLALIKVTNNTLLKDGSIEFPVSMYVDVPFKTRKTQVSKVLDVHQTTSNDIFIFVDVIEARTSQQILKKERVISKYQSETRTEPNPDYNLAQNEVNIARQRLISAQINKLSIDSEYCYGVG